MILPFSVLLSKMSSKLDFSEVWTRQRLWFSDCTSYKQREDKKSNEMEAPACKVQLREREIENQWVH